MVFRFRCFAWLLKKAGHDMYSCESDMFKRWIFRPSIHQFCCLYYVFFVAAPVGSKKHIFLPEDNTFIHILNLFRYLTQVLFSSFDICVFFTDNRTYVLALLWLCCALKIIHCSWTYCLTVSDYHISRIEVWFTYQNSQPLEIEGWIS